MVKAITSYGILRDKPPRCFNRSQMKFRTDSHSNLILDDKYAGYLERADCCYLGFERDGDDMKVRSTSTCYPISSPCTPIPTRFDFILVRCDSPITERKYQDAFGFLHRKPRVEAGAELRRRRAKNLHPHADQLSVVILGLDSVSHMNFQRYLPKTRDFLRRNLSGIEFYGRNKVSESTFENVVPTLTGWKTGELSSRAHCWKEHSAQFDACPFIWKRFADEGYRTVYGEDVIKISTFLDSTLNGFRDPVVHYDFRTLIRGLEIAEGGGGSGCFQHQSSHDILTDSILKASVAFQHRLFFQFVWLTSGTHDCAQGAKLAEEPVHRLLTTLAQEHLLNNTVFILMSDHGMTFGNYVQLEQGMLESRMPMLNIVFPPWFRAKYSLAVGNVEKNSRRLSTPFDLHAMLLDLLNTEGIKDGAIRRRQSRHYANQRGISLFLEIPKNRTCEMADIDEHWCICGGKVPVPEPGLNVRVQQAVRFAIESLNHKLEDFRVCAPLRLKLILAARKLESVQQAKNSTPMDRYDVTFQVGPSDGIFEATVMVEKDGRVMKLGGPISRINAYKKQGDCIDKDTRHGTQELRSYCFCLN